MASLFEDPKQLVRSDKITEFWPVVDHTAEERVNATARFIVYATCILYLIRRDVRVFVLGVTGLGVLYVMEKSNMIKDGMARPVFAGQGGSSCQLPTRDNPMANVLMNEYMDRPDRPSACEYSSVDDKVNNMLSDRIPYGPSRSRSALPEQQRNGYSRQFVSMPVTDIPGDQTAFAEWLYGDKSGATCRSDPRMCDPNARGAQLEAFAGLDPNGDKRSGMMRGSGLRSGTIS
jgi:hypothetical protein